ncbi:proteoglycan 4-like [Amblyraja radiata]|uniref:proteoglycan 4-like n=1 Tax=Amblyraja radiata TaxID=386614 RepID=UPI001403E01C|nr:proteoglycan 4-like [Amblyraja radiata]
MFGPSSLYSSYTSTKTDIGSTEPAQTTPPPLKEVTALKEESLCEERTLVTPSSPPPDVEEGPSKVEAPPNQTALNQADPISQTLNNPMKKVKKPVPSRPTFPPPLHPKASLPWTSKPMCASLTETIDERPIVRRATACPVRVPAVPPPPVPAPRTHQRTTSLGSAHLRLGDLPEAGGDSGKRPPEALVKTAPCQPRSPQVSWDTESQPQSKPQATARVRVLSASQAMLAGTNPKVKGSLSVERSGPQEQSPDATTSGNPPNYTT